MHWIALCDESQDCCCVMMLFAVNATYQSYLLQLGTLY